MIHLIAFMDIETGLGRTIYSDDTLTISEELIWPMICALNNFVIECTASERGLVNAALEDIKIYLYSPLGEGNPLRFVFFADLYENNAYIERRGQAIFGLLSPYISYEVFITPVQIMENVIQIATYTQIFPKEKIPSNYVDETMLQISMLEKEGKLHIADLFVGDIDQGKVFNICSNEDLNEKDSVLLFSELLTAFSLDSEIIVRSSLSAKKKRRLEHYNISPENLKEGWFLKQLTEKESDFWLVGYFYYKENYEEEVSKILSKIHKEISDFIKDSLSERIF